MGNSICLSFRRGKCRIHSGSDKRGIKVVLVGLDNAGKTSILYQLKQGRPDVDMSNCVINTTTPTIGVYRETIQYKNVKFAFWEINGGEKSRLIWTHFSGMQALIFVVDSTDRERIDEARCELWYILCHVNQTKVFIWANKQDMKGAMSTNEIRTRLRLPALNGSDWNIQLCSAYTNKGLFEGLDLLLVQKNHIN